MSLSETYLSRKELIASNLNDMGVSDASVDDGLTTLANKILAIPNKQNTSLEISVPLNLEYGDNFNITGTLTSCGGAVENASVKLKVGNTVVDTDVTDNNGSVSFTQCPVATGTHSFQLIYEGGLNYNVSSSSVVTRDVSKETSVISLSLPINNYNTYSDGEVLILGTLTDNDDTPITGKDIKVKEGNTVLKTITTDMYGEFEDSVTLGVGTHNLTFLFEEETYYTASSTTRTVNVSAPSLALSSNKSILSYKDEESCTLTATYHAFDNVGKSVSFKIYKSSDDSLLLDLGTADTDAAGVATKTFSSHGYGDVYAKAECMSLSETYEVEDCLLYDTTVYHANVVYDMTLPQSYKLSWKSKRVSSSASSSMAWLGDSDNNTVRIGILGSAGQNGLWDYVNGSSVVQNNLTTASLNVELLHEIVVNGSSVTYLCNNESTSHTTTNNTQKLHLLGIGANNKVEELKIKPL